MPEFEIVGKFTDPAEAVEFATHNVVEFALLDIDMNNFTFYSPTLFAFGSGEERGTGALVRQFGGTRVLLVTGGGSVRRNGAYAGVTASLTEAGIPFSELSGIQANPLSGKVYEGIDLCRTQGCDFLLAVGGGSVIDTAKAIGVGALYSGDFWDFFSGAAAVEKSLPVGVVLTIAAAGSEGSDSSVITHGRRSAFGGRGADQRFRKAEPPAESPHRPNSAGQRA